MTGFSDILNIDLTKYDDETLNKYYDKLNDYRREIERILHRRRNIEKFDKMKKKERKGSGTKTISVTCSCPFYLLNNLYSHRR